MRVAASAGSSRCCAVDLDKRLPHSAQSLLLHSVWRECLQDFGLPPLDIVNRRMQSTDGERLALGWAFACSFWGGDHD